VFHFVAVNAPTQRPNFMGPTAEWLVTVLC